jgi:hypothetical protein
VTASYSGDSTFAPSAGAATLSVTPIATVTAASVDPTSVTHGVSVTYKASVTSASGTPGGTVAFTVGSVTLCNVALKSGTASCTSTKAPTGSDTVTATYKGSTNYATSTGTATLKVNPDATTTAASVDPTSATTGQSVTYLATVTSEQGTPGGTVVFSIGSKTMCTATLKSGTASCTSTKAPTGSDTVTATYKATTNYTTSAGTTKLDVT